MKKDEENEKVNSDSLINSILKSLAFLTNESKTKRAEMDKIRCKIRQGKITYNQEIKKYTSLTHEIIQAENNIENIERKICKKKQLQKLFFYSFNEKFFLYLLDLKKEKLSAIYENFLYFCGFSKIETESNIFQTVLKDETELKSILEYSLIYQENLCKENNSLFKILQTKITETRKNQNIPYPFSDIYDSILLNYDIISLNEEKQKLIVQCEQFQDKKNLIFIGLKSLESQILQNDVQYKEIQTYIKGINSILEKYNNMKGKNDIENYILFQNKIKEFTNVNWNHSFTTDYALTSMTVPSEFSEDKSEISSTHKDVIKAITNIKKSSPKHTSTIQPVKNKKDNNYKHTRNISASIITQSHSVNIKPCSPSISRENKKRRASPFHQSKSQIIFQPFEEKISGSCQSIQEFSNRKVQHHSSYDELIPFSQDMNESVCEEMSPVQKNKMKIAKMVMKGPQRGYPGMIHRETQMQTFQFERNPSCGCCMSCT